MPCWFEFFSHEFYYSTKFIIHWLIVRLVIKIMNIFLIYMNIMKDYHDLCLMFYYYWLSYFRKEPINYFKLHPARYLSTPGYIWDAMLKFLDVNIKFISDIEKYQFFESTIRSYISKICKGYAEANNKFLKPYDANKPTCYIIYLHTNKFYGLSLMQLLPTEILDWVDPKNFSLDSYSNDSRIGFFLIILLILIIQMNDLIVC